MSHLSKVWHGLLVRVGVLFPTFIAFLCMSKVVFGESGYEVLYGDFNGDGAGDIYFHRLDKFVLIHGDIPIPIYAPAEGSFVIYGGSSAVAEMNATKSSMQPYTAGVEGTDYYVRDEDGDGDIDLSAHDKNNNSRIVTLYLSASAAPVINIVSANPLVQNFTYDVMGRLRAIEEDGAVSESLQYDRAGNRCRVSSSEISEEGYCDE